MDWLHWLTIHAPAIFAAMMWFGPGWCCPPPCPNEIECEFCPTGIGPGEFLVEVSGVADNGNCTSPPPVLWNGSWVVPFEPGNITFCEWTDNPPGEQDIYISRDCIVSVSFTISIIATLNISDALQFIATFSMGLGGGDFRQYIYRDDALPEDTCLNLVSRVLPNVFHPSQVGSGSVPYNATTATVALTSL